MWYVVTDRSQPRDCVTLPGGVVAWWVRVRLASGAVAYGAQFDAARCTDVPGLRRIRGRSVLDDSQVVPIETPTSSAPDEVVSSADLVSRVLALALRQGWTPEDLAGAGDGDAGEKGGRARVAGLSLAEAALSMPPVDWPELRAAGRRPWESTAWRISSPGWRPPPTPALPPPPQRVVDEAVPAPTFDASPASASPTATAEPEDATPAAGTLEELLSTRLAPDHVLYDYPQDGLAHLVTLVRELAKAKGAAPHQNAVNYQLKRQGLAQAYRCTNEQIRAILALI